MKVLLINGSPHQKGCTFTALSEISDTFQQEGIDSDIYWIGNKPIGGCIACFQCAKKQKCVFDDKINEFTNLGLRQGHHPFHLRLPV
ncbi:MAG: flavodoxin family protein [Lachnospiraceae bacterium]|nr:flavodoxin family protein [Lachnospiraceae bacterium]